MRISFLLPAVATYHSEDARDVKNGKVSRNRHGECRKTNVKRGVFKEERGSTQRCESHVTSYLFRESRKDVIIIPYNSPVSPGQ